jgi:hypothetical protein
MGASSDPTTVKPVNSAERSAAELVEPRAGAEGNASQFSTGRMQTRETVSQGLERIRQAAGKGSGEGSPRSSTTSVLICSGRDSANSSGMLRAPRWTLACSSSRLRSRSAS